MSAAVADAGPLIHLDEIGCLALLRLFDSVQVPDAVWSESLQPGRVREPVLLALDVIRRHRLSSDAVTRFVAENSLTRLQAGENEALYLCRQIGASTLLTDDLAVRSTAQRLGINPVGSLGVIVGAYHKGYVTLTEAEQYLAGLYSVSSLYVTRTVVDLAIEKLHLQSE